MLLKQLQKRATKMIKGLKHLLEGRAERAGAAEPREEKAKEGSYQCI